MSKLRPKVRVRTAKMVLSVLLVAFLIMLFVPALNRQEQKLEQNVACVKTVCIDNGSTNACDNISSQVVHYQIVRDRTGDTLLINLTGKSCL